MDCCDWTGKTIFQSAGGRVVPAGNPVFDNISALAEFRVDPSQNGLLVWVLSVLDAFVYESGSEDAEDGITVVLPPDGASGRWIRLQWPNEHWARQATWYIRADAGDDENTGQTDSAPLRSHAELARRINGLTVPQPTTITVLSSLPEVLKLHVELVDSPAPAMIAYIGAQLLPLLRSGGTISDLQLVNIPGDPTEEIPSNTPLSFADSTLTISWEEGGPDASSLIGHRIRIASSSNTDNVDAVAWLALQDASDVRRVRCSPFVKGSTAVTPLEGDRYVVEDLMIVQGFDLNLQRRGGGAPVCVIRDLAITADPVYNTRLKSDNAESRYIVTGCYVQANMLEVDRGNIEGSRLQAGNSGRIVIQGKSLYVIAGLTIDSGHVIETPSALFYSGDHLVQGNGDLGMVVRAPVVEMNGLAFFDCNPALVVHHGGAVRVGFLSSNGATALWGAGNGAAPEGDDDSPQPAVVVEPGAFIVYDSPTVSGVPGACPAIDAIDSGIRFSIGGVDDRTPPYVNPNNGAGFVNRNGNGS